MKWTKVSDRLPGKVVNCLIKDTKGDRAKCAFIEMNGIFHFFPEDVAVGFKSEEVEFWVSIDELDKFLSAEVE